MKRTLCLLAATLLAAPALLGCSVTATGVGHFGSLNAALAALPDRDGNHLVVSGVCAEKVEIRGHFDLTISGTPGARLEPPAGDVQPHRQTMNIRTSDSVNIHDLTITGRTNVTGAMSIRNSREIQVSDSVIESGGLEGGVWVISSTGVFLRNVTIRNSGNAIRIDGSRVVIEGAWEAGSTGVARLENNGTGARINQGASLSLRGHTIITGNAIGVQSNGGNLSVCCFEDIAYPRIEGNRFYGIFMRGGDVQIQAPITVSANGSWGMVFIGTNARVWTASVGDNGAGILMLSGVLDLSQTEVSSNGGAGVVLSSSASGRMNDVTINGNRGEGVDVQSISTLGIFSGSVRGNRAFDVRCSPNSHAYGSSSVVGKMQCPGFNNAPDPTPGNLN